MLDCKHIYDFTFSFEEKAKIRAPKWEGSKEQAIKHLRAF
jgi:hypothetical protein